MIIYDILNNIVLISKQINLKTKNLLHCNVHQHVYHLDLVDHFVLQLMEVQYISFQIYELVFLKTIIQNKTNKNKPKHMQYHTIKYNQRVCNILAQTKLFFLPALNSFCFLLYILSTCVLISLISTISI